MPIPVTVPGTPLAIDDYVNSQAESLLTAVVQLVANGTSGSTITTPALTFPSSTNPQGPPVSVVIDTAPGQLFSRQTLIAIAQYISNFTNVTASCLISQAIGDLVYFSSSNTAVLTDGNAIGAKVPVVGIIILKPTTTSCIIQTSGIVRNVLSGLTAGAQYYVNASGRPSTSPTANPIKLGVALDSTTLLLRII